MDERGSFLAEVELVGFVVSSIPEHAHCRRIGTVAPEHSLSKRCVAFRMVNIFDSGLVIFDENGFAVVLKNKLSYLLTLIIFMHCFDNLNYCVYCFT